MASVAGSSSAMPMGDVKNGFGDDLENDFDYGTSVATSSARVRMGFLRKVYGLLAVQLTVTTAICLLFMAVAPLRNFAASNPYISMIGAVGAIIVLIPLLIYRDRSPLNLQLLFGFTIMESISIATICALYQAQGYGFIVFQAFVGTAVVFGCLTAYCFLSKKDFSFLGGFLVSGLTGLLVCSLVQLVLALFGVRFNWMNLLISAAGVIIFSGYILFDTSMLIHKHSADEYILATVNIYLDLINLFLYMLQILSLGQRDS